MCIVAGICFGFNFTPVIYIKNNYPKLNVSEKCGPTEDPCLKKISQKGWSTNPDDSAILLEIEYGDMNVCE